MTSCPSGVQTAYAHTIGGRSEPSEPEASSCFVAPILDHHPSFALAWEPDWSTHRVLRGTSEAVERVCRRGAKERHYPNWWLSAEP